MTEQPRQTSRLILAAGIGLLAFNMRPSLSSLGPVLPEVMRDTGLNPATAGLLTTLPVLFLGIFGLLGPGLARRLGPERTILAFMLVLTAGLAMRVLGGAGAMILGCALGGVAIGVVNVLVPSIIKRRFPDQAANMMGFYTMALCAGAAAAAATSAPLERALGGFWPGALAVWALPALLAAAAWLVQIGPRPDPSSPPPPKVEGLWRDPLAWQVTLFTGLQSSLAYSIFAWLAPMLRARGYAAVDAGFVVSVSILLQAPAALLTPMVSGRFRDQRVAAVIVVACSAIGFAGCVFAPAWTVWLWAVILAIGQGGTFALALTIIVLRAPDSPSAAKLSAMAQGIGYSFASAGPLLIGSLRSWTGGWGASSALFFAIAAATALAGLGAGRAMLVRSRTLPAPGAA